MKKENASTKSVQEFRDAVVVSLGAGSAVLLDMIDVLATGSRLGSPVELALSGLFAYNWNSLYQALRRAEDQLADTIEEDYWLRQLCAARLNWLKDHPPDSPREELGQWRVRILDASNYNRPPQQLETPTPRQAEAIYDERFSIEHSIRFLKSELGMTAGQFNGQAAEGRVQVWVELAGQDE